MCIRIKFTITPYAKAALQLKADSDNMNCRGSEVTAQVTLGSVKSCYGHTEGTAGLTGALLAIQTLHNQVLRILPYIVLPMSCNAILTALSLPVICLITETCHIREILYCRELRL